MGYLREVRPGPRPRRRSFCWTTLVQSFAPRHINRCSEAPAGHTNRCRDLPPSAKQVGVNVADPSASGNSAHICWKGEIGRPRRTVSYTHERPIIFDNLDRLPEDGERVAGRAGVFVHPTAKGSRSGGWEEPFAPFCLRASTTAARRARPRPGCGMPRRGLASLRRLGEGNGAAAEHEEGDLVLRSLLNCPALKAVHRSSFRP
jgi:hypothetical protein